MTNLDPYLAVYFITFVVLILLKYRLHTQCWLQRLNSLYLTINHLLCLHRKQQTPLADFNMLALPAFLFVGCFMNEVGLTHRLFGMFEKWIGHLPGGLAHANVLSSMVFAGMSGSALADAGGLGTIEVSAMSKAGYDPDFSVAVTAASAGIGPIIPPSINFVVWAFLSQTSTLAMFQAGMGWCPDGRGHDDLDSDCSENPAHCLPAGTEGILGRAIPLSVYITSGTGWPGYPGTLAL